MQWLHVSNLHAQNSHGVIMCNCAQAWAVSVVCRRVYVSVSPSLVSAGGLRSCKLVSFKLNWWYICLLWEEEIMSFYILCFTEVASVWVLSSNTVESFNLTFTEWKSNNENFIINWHNREVSFSTGKIKLTASGSMNVIYSSQTFSQAHPLVRRAVIHSAARQNRHNSETRCR